MSKRNFIDKPAEEMGADSYNNLYKVEVDDGATYWVSARTAAQAPPLIEDAEDLDFWCGLTVSAVSLEEANQTIFYDDQYRETRMANEFNRDPSERLVACSEF